MAAIGSDLSKNLPAPKTFAPSREDVLSTLGFFFGDPAVPEKLKDYSEHHAMTYHFPDAFYGQNTKYAPPHAQHESLCSLRCSSTDHHTLCAYSGSARPSTTSS